MKLPLKAVRLPARSALLVVLCTSLGHAQFRLQELPLHAYKLYDLGVVDFNGDGHLDLYSTNCNALPNLLQGAGDGTFRNVTQELGLAHDAQCPGFAMLEEAPVADAPGLYIYFLMREIHIRAHRTAETDGLRGSIEIPLKAEVALADGFTLQSHDTHDALGVARTRYEFSTLDDGLLVLVPPIPTGPIGLDFPDIPLREVFLGAERQSPGARSLQLLLHDPHSMAWSDVNGDGLLDVYIGIGGLQARAELIPAIEASEDRLLLQQEGRFVAKPIPEAIEKQGCANRRASWADVNGDNLLDLHLLCWRDQCDLLYRRETKGPALRFGAAPEIGTQVIESNSRWLDFNLDQRVDLLGVEGRSTLALYENTPEGRFIRYRLTATKDISYLAVSDMDNDGQWEILAVSPMGNRLINGELIRPEPVDSLGLPAAAHTACWGDFDNDGLLDLYMQPGGLLRQREDGRFIRDQSMPEAPAMTGTRALCTWFDANNDGRLDLVRATQLEQERWQVDFLLNEVEAGNWLEVDLHGPTGNAEAVGARVEVEAAGRRLMRRVGEMDGAYSGQGHYRLHFGLGQAEDVVLTVYWPDGATQVVPVGGVNQLLQVDYLEAGASPARVGGAA